MQQLQKVVKIPEALHLPELRSLAYIFHHHDHFIVISLPQHSRLRDEESNKQKDLYQDIKWLRSSFPEVNTETEFQFQCIYLENNTCGREEGKAGSGTRMPIWI